MARGQPWSPVVPVNGPRQSGKTTLCRASAPALPYVNLERPDTGSYAIADPGGLLAQFPNGAVLDGIQRTPALLSWLQVLVDEDKRPGRFIRNGRHSFELKNAVAQSLAGRTALLQPLPLPPPPPLAELRAAGLHTGTDRLLHAGGYPRIHADGLDPAVALADCAATDVERDLRQLIEVRELDAFRRFLRLAASLIGITQQGHRDTHPLRGALFENLVVMEFVKHALHQGQPAGLHYLRDSSGLEVDLVVEQGLAAGQQGLVEVKSGMTMHGSLLQPLHKLAALLGPKVVRHMLLYGGAEQYQRAGVEVVGLQAAAA